MRGETDTLEKMQRRLEHDLYFIDNWSFMFDLKIIIMTPVLQERVHQRILIVWAILRATACAWAYRPAVLEGTDQCLQQSASIRLMLRSFVILPDVSDGL